MKQFFILSHDQARCRALEAIAHAPQDFEVVIRPPTRSGAQNAKFHAICSDMERAGFEWFGKRRTAEEIKVLLVSGHAQATKQGSEVVAGLEGELVNLRESTALMSKSRSSSLIEYALAFCAQHGIEVQDAVPQ